MTCVPFRLNAKWPSLAVTGYVPVIKFQNALRRQSSGRWGAGGITTRSRKTQ